VRRQRDRGAVTAAIAARGGVAVVPLTGDNGVLVIVLYPLLVGVQLDLPINFSGHWTGWTILADLAGSSIVIDLWKDTYANYPPTVAGTITGTSKPTLAVAQKNQDMLIPGWITQFVAGDILRVNVDSMAVLTRVTLGLNWVRDTP
jgi:hypothetical protein